MADKFWTTSGRVDSYAFEIVDSTSYTKHVGWLKGITSGRLTFGYDTDLKVSGSLDVSSDSYIDPCVVRVHYKPKLADEQRDIILATCFASVTDMNFDKGRYKGKLDLRSTLARYADDELRTDFTICKGKTYKAEFKRYIKDVCPGGKYKFNADVKDKKCPKSLVIERGKKGLAIVQAIAKGLDARVDVDEYGTLIFEKYTAPSKKKKSYDLPVGQYSVTLPLINVSNNKPEMPNRVAYACNVSWKQEVYMLDDKGNKKVYTSGEKKGKYMTTTETKKKVVTGRAQVSKSHPLHYVHRGRWVSKFYSYDKKLAEMKITDTEKLNKALNEVQKDANNKAAAQLSRATTGLQKYEITCYYLPIQTGDVVAFHYTANGIKIHVEAMVINIEKSIAIGGKMKVTLKKVRTIKNG